MSINVGGEKKKKKDNHGKADPTKKGLKDIAPFISHLLSNLLSFLLLPCRPKHLLLTKSYFSERWSLRHQKLEKPLLLAGSFNS